MGELWGYFAEVIRGRARFLALLGMTLDRGSEGHGGGARNDTAEGPGMTRRMRKARDT